MTNNTWKNVISWFLLILLYVTLKNVALLSDSLLNTQPEKTKSGGRLSTVHLLIKVACFVKSK